MINPLIGPAIIVIAAIGIFWTDIVRDVKAVARCLRDAWNRLDRALIAQQAKLLAPPSWQSGTVPDESPALSDETQRTMQMLAAAVRASGITLRAQHQEDIVCTPSAHMETITLNQALVRRGDAPVQGGNVPFLRSDLDGSYTPLYRVVFPGVHGYLNPQTGEMLYPTTPAPSLDYTPGLEDEPLVSDGVRTDDEKLMVESEEIDNAEEP